MTEKKVTAIWTHML